MLANEAEHELPEAGGVPLRGLLAQGVEERLRNARGVSNRGLRQAAVLAHPHDELGHHRRPEGAGRVRAYDACLAEIA